MQYPENLKIGDTIGICAPSDGITDEDSIKKLEQAINNLKQKGYQVIETPSVRKSIRGRSASAEQRAKEFMELLEDEKVKLILFATGGDFLIEILPYLDWEYIKTLPPKWLQGYSDITGIEFLWTTLLDTASIYCQTIKDYAMQPWYANLSNALEFAKGNQPEQHSFAYHEKVDFSAKENENYTYKLTEKTIWKNLYAEKELTMQGRLLGGCLDIIQSLWGTKWDKIHEYIEKYKDEGIIWYLECFEISTPELYRKLWQMQQAGYFQYCKGIIFGRPLFIKEDYGMSHDEAIKEIMQNLQIPIITGADIGHVAPQMAMINGAIVKITSKEGKGSIITYFK